ncbi:MAG: hypothetical protein ACKV2T_02650 [Kofleriaceae bacterium]
MMQLLFALVLPLMLVMVRRRAAINIAISALATWVATSLALCAFNSEDVLVFLLFLFVLLPAFTVGVAMVLATTFGPRPRMWFDAGFLAMIGWWIGLLVLLFTPTTGLATNPELWDCAVFIAYPALYAGAFAGFGASNKPVASPPVA